MPELASTDLTVWFLRRLICRVWYIHCGISKLICTGWVAAYMDRRVPHSQSRSDFLFQRASPGSSTFPGWRSRRRQDDDKLVDVEEGDSTDESLPSDHQRDGSQQQSMRMSPNSPDHQRGLVQHHLKWVTFHILNFRFRCYRGVQWGCMFWRTKGWTVYMWILPLSETRWLMRHMRNICRHQSSDNIKASSKLRWWHAVIKVPMTSCHHRNSNVVMPSCHHRSFDDVMPSSKSSMSSYHQNSHWPRYVLPISKNL